MAWSHMTRAANPSDWPNRTVLVAAGFDESTRVLGQPVSFQPGPQRTAVAPAVACGESGAAGGWDCVLVLVGNNTNLNLSTIRFNVTWSSQNGYSVVREMTCLNPPFSHICFPVQHAVDNEWPTPQDVEIWTHEGTWYIAMKFLDFVWCPQCIAVFSSSNGADWSPYTFLSGTSATGPTVAPFIQSGQNRLIRVAIQ